MKEQTQQQPSDHNAIGSSRLRRISSQDATKQEEKHPPETLKLALTLLEQLSTVLRELQKMSVPFQVFTALAVIFAILGIIAIFFLVALLPNAYIGISALLSALGGFWAGRVSKR